MRGAVKNAKTRKALLKPVRRVVVKVGSGVLTTSKGLNRQVIQNLADDICFFREKGLETILISSGAIASGLRKLGMKKRPASISHQQAVAAVGQSSLMMAYEKAFGRHGQKVAQILVTRDDLNHRRRYLNARNTLFTLLSWKIIPVINENDTVVVDEIKFGDNDNLSAMVTNLTGSNLLISLTDIDGLYDKDPRAHRDARLIYQVDQVSRVIMRYASSIPGFLGTGGMASKISAAKKVSMAGVPMIIANGTKAGILKGILSGEAEGTLFLPREETLCSRKHWIAFAKATKGEIIVDRGAEEALLKSGRSLLPTGILEVKGNFGVGDSAVVRNGQGRKLAVGMVNYPSGEMAKIKGLRSNQIEAVLGYKHDDEVIHRDNLVITDELEKGDEECQ